MTTAKAISTRMTIEEIEAELEIIGDLEYRIKQAAMIYQREAKERKAEANGLPFDAYYHLPYAEWAAIRDSNGT